MNLSNNNNATTEAGITDSSISPGKSTSNKSKSSNDDGVCEVNDMVNKMSTADNHVSVCANCGKDGANNICNKCKQVKYCHAVCKKIHKKKHKKECEEHVRLAAELHDKKLFKQPSLEDCPICFLTLPSLNNGHRYMSCCGKVICSGCFYAPVYDNQGNEVDNEKCPFCRTPVNNSPHLGREWKRVEAGDSIAIYNIGCLYRDGKYGYPRDHSKALEHWLRAAELGHAGAHLNIGYAYELGEGVDIDKKKSKHYYELAAMAGDADARHNLGINEEEAGNMERALKHHMIAVRAGDNDSLKEIQELYSEGFATKGDYLKALQSYQAYLGEIKSRQRDEAAAADEDYRYY